jgi:fructose-1,6-bisphosphatase/inositol monophosphatase family enzyme
MPRPKQMIKRSEIEIAKAKRTCRFTGKSITKGSRCLVLYEGPQDRFCYSRSTALEMIRLARGRLDELESQLSQAQPDGESGSTWKAIAREDDKRTCS